ncbi:hypothetical protein Daesc_007074 [Daldinia eschscholtzii]|uniref:Uncharacterized protein n=1 Tax=Daldinia eschscholtzii TaxID=292717 RepID=A0AAX6MJB3_9PEZI
MADSTPSMERPGIKPHTYNLDDVNMVSSLMTRPLLQSDLRLSDYGTIIHESEEKLAIVINHRNPELLLAVIRHAWVNEYLELGAPCIMRFGPLIQYQSVLVMFEREETDASHSTSSKPESRPQEQTQPQSTALSDSTTSPDTSPSKPRLLYPILEHERPPSSNEHPMANFDYLSELQVQFTRHAARFPEAYRIASRSYSGPRSYIPRPGAPLVVYQIHPNGQTSRAPLPYQATSSSTGYHGSRGYRCRYDTP